MNMGRMTGSTLLTILLLLSCVPSFAGQWIYTTNVEGCENYLTFQDYEGTYVFNVMQLEAMPCSGGAGISKMDLSPVLSEVSANTSAVTDLTARVEALEAGGGGEGTGSVLPSLTIEDAEILSVGVIMLLAVAWVWRRLQHSV